MRSQVQVLAGPPTNPAGHSAAGREPGALAATLGRAGAARPSPPASPSGPPGPPTRAAGLTTTTHRGRHPGPDGSHAAGASTSRRSLILCLAPPPATGATHAGLAWSLSGHAPPPYPTGARVRHRRPADQHASRQHRSRPGLLGRRPNRSTARQPTGTRPVAVVTGARRTDLGPMPPPGRGGDGTHPDRRGGHQPAGRWPGGHQRAGHRTGGQQATGPPDTWTTNPGDRTPDGLDTGRLDRRTPGRRHRMGGHPMLDTARRPMPWLASWPCRPGRRCLTAGCRLDALPGRRRLGEQQPRPSAAGDTPPSSWRLGALLSSEKGWGRE